MALLHPRLFSTNVLLLATRGTQTASVLSSSLESRLVFRSSFHDGNFRQLSKSAKTTTLTRAIATTNLNRFGQLDTFNLPLIVKGVLNFSAVSQPKPLDTSSPQLKTSSDKSGKGKPTAEQIDSVYLKLKDDLPKFFRAPQDYRIYSPNIIFVDNIRVRTAQGLPDYLKQLVWVKVAANWQLARIRLELVSIEKKLDAGKIVVHWRVHGGVRVFLKFWKIRWWKKPVVWQEGISHYEIGGDGCIFRHTVENASEEEKRVEGNREAKVK